MFKKLKHDSRSWKAGLFPPQAEVRVIVVQASPVVVQAIAVPVTVDLAIVDPATAVQLSPAVALAIAPRIDLPSNVAQELKALVAAVTCVNCKTRFKSYEKHSKKCETK